LNEREKRERASREREQEREEARAKPAREEKKSVLFSRERERERAEPAAFRRPALVHCQLESEGETPCPGGARELCLGRERERESRKRFSKLLFSSESGSSLEEISRLHKLTFFYLLLQKKP
jgi:hypothetical protein